MGTFGFFSLSCQMFSPASSRPAFPLQPHFPILAFPMFLEGSTTAPQVRNFHDRLLSQKFPIPCKAICTTLKLHTLAMTPLQNLAIDVHVCIAHLSCSYITNTYHTPCCIKLLFSRLFFFLLGYCLSKGPVRTSGILWQWVSNQWLGSIPLIYF